MKTGFAKYGAPLLALGFLLCSAAYAEQRSPEASIGERLFKEPRFAQLFFVQCNGNVNATTAGDPNLAETQTTGSPLPGSFAGQTMSCSVCHMEDEQAAAPGGGIRAYADFSRRSLIPARTDGKTTTVRNAPSLVSASVARPLFFLHYDGEFASGADLALGTFTGRNFGWLPGEQATAIKHIANVIRNDNGQGALAQQFGGAYAKVLAADSSVPTAFQLPKQFQLEVAHASDAKVVAAIDNLVNAFLQSLHFSQDSGGLYNGSPYDLFLVRNNLPRAPNAKEARLDYSRRLRAAVAALANPVFVTPADGQFTTHAIPYQFGPGELAGLQLFLAEPGSPAPGLPPPPPGAPAAAVGNCISCHNGPEFTDFSFHNIGISQLEYDGVQGAGAFMNLSIPATAARKKDAANSFPPSAKHPAYKGNFRSIPTAGDPNLVDLGMWNIFGNPDVPKPQKEMKALALQAFGHLKADDLLAKSVATYKTPGLRDLLDSQPYFHNGSIDDFSGVLGIYLQVSQMARNNQLRNADPRLAGIALTPDQAAQIVLFLNSLTEDFND